MRAEPVCTKISWYRRERIGEFGNRLRNWPSLNAIVNSGFTGRIGLRYQKPNSPFCRYDLELSEVPSVVEDFVSRGADPGLILYCEAADDSRVTFQGELLLDTESHYQLLYSTYKAQMRIALSKEPKWASGLAALTIIKHFFNPNSLNDLMDLIELYPAHAIEFSAYSINVGCCAHRNVLIWEVRKF